ncbi:MAG TPA: Na+ dependent nucleoside transporter N-terminal domain-containing protein, partial [Longimicrobiales bacterium]
MHRFLRHIGVVLFFILGSFAPLAAQAGAQGATDSVPAQATGVGSGGHEMADSLGTSAAGVQAPPEGYAEDVQTSEGARGAPGPRSLGDTRHDLGTTWFQRLISLVGIVVMLLICWAISYDRKDIPWRVIAYGLGLQFVFALFILKTPIGEGLFAFINDMIVSLLGFTVQGASFLFGDLVWGQVPVGSGPAGTNAPFTPTPGMVARTGAFFAFNVLPTIIFFSSLMAVLYYLGVMQKVVKGIAWVMMR